LPEATSAPGAPAASAKKYQDSVPEKLRKTPSATPSPLPNSTLPSRIQTRKPLTVAGAASMKSLTDSSCEASGPVPMSKSLWS
jgi:hypothetical protein